MEMSIDRVGAEGNFVNVAIAGADRFFGNGRKTVGVTLIAASIGECTSKKFVHMLIFVTVTVVVFSAEGTGFQAASAAVGLSAEIAGLSITITTIAHIKVLL